MQYFVNENSSFKNGLIVIEKPHQGPSHIWASFDHADFIERVVASANQRRADVSEWDFSTFDGASDYLRHDLSTLRIVEFFDIDPDWLDDPARDLASALLMLDWIVPIEQDDNE